MPALEPSSRLHRAIHENLVKDLSSFPSCLGPPTYFFIDKIFRKVYSTIG
jgi:hypothetical protein